MSFCPFRACCYSFDTLSYICISNAQYCSFSAQQNLWCEILEFWACSDSVLTYSWLCCWEEKCAMNDGAKQASLGCNSATFTLQYSLYCLTKEPLFHTNSGSVGVEKRLFLYIMGATLKQNHTKTAFWFSIIDFYFVTAFYSLYDICMATLS